MMPASLIVEFREPEQLLSAVHRARSAGYRRLETFSPFPLNGMDAALDLPPTRLRAVMPLAAVLSAVSAYALQHWSAVYAYPINSGGRPLASWPAFLIVTFEVAILGAALGGFGALIVRAELTRLDNPLFAVPGFERASQDRFFLSVDAADPKFDAEVTRRFLESLGGTSVHQVPP